MNGIHEVRGSIPLVSTNRIIKIGRQGTPFLFLVKELHFDFLGSRKKHIILKVDVLVKIHFQFF